ncbi:MAG: AAA family ATPase [Bacteroidales bacterium]|nr:AAA family ATPase [Bacteroidales bacterium]
MCGKRSTKNQEEYNLTLNFTDEGDEPDYLSMIESISYDVEECGLLFEIIPDQESLLSLSDFLSLSLSQSALFSVLAEMSLREDVTIDLLARFFKCKVVRILSLLDQIEFLEKRGFVKRIVKTEKRKETYRDLSFTVPKNVMEALRTANPGLLETNRKLDFTALLDQLKQALNEREDELITVPQFLREAESLLKQGSRLPFVHYLNTKLSKTSSKTLALLLVLFRLSGRADTPSEYFFSILFSNLREQIEFGRHMTNGRHELVRSGVVKLSSSEHDSYQLVLGPEAQNLLSIDFPDLALADVGQNKLRSHKAIKEKTLYFNAEAGNRIIELEKLLGRKEFIRYRESAARLGMSHGITAIFFGPPGTGKTELALQIARKTQRDLMMVDLSQTRSMWFGESEKQVKRIFDHYRELLVASQNEPILFINEADQAVRQQIWLSKLPELTQEMAETLAPTISSQNPELKLIDINEIPENLRANLVRVN